MNFRFLLWLNAIVFAVYLAGHLFDIFIIIPNFRSGSVEEIMLFNDFFHKTNPVNFYRVIMWISCGISLLCFITYLRAGNPILGMLMISVVIDMLLYMVTMYYIRPMNEYLLTNQVGVLYQEGVAEYVRIWITANYLRIGLIVIGFYASVLAIHFSYSRRRATPAKQVYPLLFR